MSRRKRDASSITSSHAPVDLRQAPGKFLPHSGLGPVGGSPDGRGRGSPRVVPADLRKNPATSVADGGIGMTTGGAKSLRKMFGAAVAV